METHPMYNNKPIDLTKISQKLSSEKWMIIPSVHQHLCNKFESLVPKLMDEGIPLIQTGVEESMPKALEEESSSKIAIIRVNGVLGKHISPLEKLLLGGFDLDDLWYALDDVQHDDAIECVLIDFDSPGGTVTFVEECGRKIEEVAKTKDVYAWTDSCMCSAAYWLASQCDMIYASPSSQVGSVGVFSLVLDETKKIEAENLKLNTFVSGKYKAMGHTFHTLTDEEKKMLQDDVELQHRKFKDVIKKHRSIKDEDLEGKVYEGQMAMTTNYIDAQVDSLTELCNTLEKDYQDDNSAQSNKTASTAKVEASSNKGLKTMKVENIKKEADATPKLMELISTVETQLSEIKKMAGSYGKKYEEEEEEEETEKCSEGKTPNVPGMPIDKDKKSEEEETDKKADGPNDKPDKSEPDRDVPLQDTDSKEKNKYQEKDEHPEPDSDDVGGEGDDDDDDDEEEEEEKPSKKMESSTPEQKFEFNTLNWKKAISEMSGDPKPQMEMAKPDDNLIGWKKAVSEFSGHKI